MDQFVFEYSATKHCLHASHFCYLMAEVDFGSFLKKTSKLVLIGSNHKYVSKCSIVSMYMSVHAVAKIAIETIGAYCLAYFYTAILEGSNSVIKTETFKFTFHSEFLSHSFLECILS